MTFAQLRARFAADSALGSTGAVAAFARALERIGWRAVREPTPEELAEYVVDLVRDCVQVHRDIAALTHAIASALREVGPLLDGGLPPVEAYVPAAEELLELYVRDDGIAARAPESFEVS